MCNIQMSGKLLLSIDHFGHGFQLPGFIVIPVIPIVAQPTQYAHLYNVVSGETDIHKLIN